MVAEFVAGTGGQGAGLAYQILLAGIQLNIPRLFAALVLIALAGVAFFAATVWVARISLSRWHERAHARGVTGARRRGLGRRCGRTPGVRRVLFSLLCAPLQNGAVPVCLQPHR